MLVDARLVPEGRQRGFVRKARNLQTKAKGKDAKGEEEALPAVDPFASVLPVPAVTVPVTTELRVDTATATSSSKSAKKSTKSPAASVKGTKSSKKGSLPPPPPPGFRVEVPLADTEIWTDTRLLDDFGNETFANETFANETFANETFISETLSNETLPPADAFFNDTFSNETDAFLSGNETSAPVFSLTANDTLPPAPVPAVRLKLVGEQSACLTFNQSLEVINCDAAGDLADWEILESSDPELFQLRHVESQLCLPENPESPERAFDCWISEVDKAVGDTINGLVNCSDPFAAFVGFIDPANPSYLYNAVCSTGNVGAPSDVVLMAYTSGGSTELLWGEKILLDVPQMTVNATYTLSGSFFLAEA
jgi:hypothetical protein